MYEGRVAWSGVSIPICLYMPDLRFAICVCVAGLVILTCRLIGVCDAGMGVALIQFVINDFGPVRNSRL